MRRERNFIGPAGMGGTVGLWGASSMVQSVQYGTTTLSSVATSNTATIAAVNVSHAILIDLRQSNNWSGGTQPAYTSNTLALTNSTTVTAFRNASGGIELVAAFAVLELAPGVVKSIQSGRVAGAGTVTATITGVNTAKTFLLSLGLEGDSGGRDDAFYARMALTNSTTITFTRGASAGGGPTAGWIAIEEF